MRQFFAKARKVLSGKGGELYVDNAIMIIIAVVIGSLLLAGLYALFNGLILPGLAERIQDMFGSPGGGGSGGSGDQIIFL